MTPEQLEYTNWLNSCHKKLSKEQRIKWLTFYKVWFASTEYNNIKDNLK